ncbi:MAG: hypothetical protein PHS74_04660 [Lachnospiraceae bacterium]|nr:hypothetical protein [Lachnospiraceae bacterium]
MEITKEDKQQFKQACDKIIAKERERFGIGTLSEKTVHAVLKNYLVPKAEYHEQKCEGYVADILYEGEIMEIQTAGFDKLRRKLDAFLPNYEVTIVYPIPATKWLYWIDEETGELSPKRKSNRKGSCYQVFPELYKIKMYLKNPHLHLRLLLMDMEEYRLLNGWNESKKKGASRFDRIPIALQDDILINSPAEYSLFLPEELPEEFTSADYKKVTKLTLGKAQTALNILTYLEIVERIGKSGHSILYTKKRLPQKRKRVYTITKALQK